VLEFTDSDAPGGGFMLKWSSEPFKTYSISRATNITEAFSVLEAGLPATPPVNTYTDTNSIGLSPVFYLINVE
jgi:hypothetical protein